MYRLPHDQRVNRHYHTKLEKGMDNEPAQSNHALSMNAKRKMKKKYEDSQSKIRLCETIKRKGWMATGLF